MHMSRQAEAVMASRRKGRPIVAARRSAGRDGSGDALRLGQQVVVSEHTNCNFKRMPWPSSSGTHGHVCCSLFLHSISGVRRGAVTRTAVADAGYMRAGATKQ